ncbi:histidine--tRNA ligase [Brucella pseudogrignonensis]|uniref:histidine--tRNA ligase n=1 Tax=Brucella pseudogrignonensis TaxID=419475 RepID=UPI0038B4D20B
MADKADKMKARLPRGFVDRVPDDLRATEKMTATIREVYDLYGFEPVETPLIEYTDALGKFLPDQDRPNEGVFSFQDDDEQWLSLRYDLTAPLARFVAENYESLPKPYRSYRNGWVFRNEKPGPGRFRQFMQFDADTVGAPNVSADAEMCMMMADTVERLGIARGDYVIRVNNRKVLDGVLEAVGLAGGENAGKRLNVLRAIDKLDKFGAEGVRLLLGQGRRDESGDFTKGVELDNRQINFIVNFITVTKRDYDGPSQKDALDPVFSYAPTNGDDFVEKPLLQAIAESGFNATPIMLEGLKELEDIRDLAKAAGYDDGRIVIDPSCVRGLEYYTGPVFEAELLFDVTNEDGQKVVFGSVGGGGRYDGLVSRFRGEPVPATGFSIGVSRLMTALKNLGKLDVSDVVGPVVVLVMDKDAQSLGGYQKMVSQLRQAGIRAEMYVGGSGMKAQMKYADRRDAPCVIIQGSQEREAGEVQIKDLIEGKRISAEIEDNATWRESRPAQVTVKEEGIVAAVREILEAQARDRAQQAK